MRLDSWKDRLVLALDIVLVIVLVVLWYYSSVRDRSNVLALEAEVENTKVEQAEVAEEQRIEEETAKQESIYTEVLQAIEENMQGIICWGDGLTAGSGGGGTSYPAVLRTSITENVINPIYEAMGVDAANPGDKAVDIPVINMGVPGEDSITIAGRSGAIPYVTYGKFTLPETTDEAVPISIVSSHNNAKVAPLRQGVVGMEYVTIDGVQGVLEIEQESPASKTFKYTFKRSEAGEAKEVDAGTPIIPAGANFKSYIPVIFIGQNGGFDSLAQLITQQRAIINNQVQTERFIVLGLTSGTAQSRAEMEAAMVAEFGDKYINLREYLSTDGLKDAGMDPTSEDLAATAVGSVPPSLLANDIDINSTGYELIGKKIYQRMDELGYFAEVNGVLSEEE